MTQEPRILEEFTDLVRLGKGAFGDVISGKHRLDGIKYAIKMIELKSRTSERAREEVQMMAKLDHQGVVRYYDSWIEEVPEDGKNDYDRLINNAVKDEEEEPEEESDDEQDAENTFDDVENEPSRNTTNEFDETAEENSSSSKTPINSSGHLSTSSGGIVFQHEENFQPGYLYIRMQLCTSTLEKWLKANETHESRDFWIVWRWFRQLAEAVKYLHQKGIIHRDIKPGNIFIFGKDRLKIGDFGLSIDMTYRNAHSRDAQYGTSVYRSPEMEANTWINLGKKLQYKTDVYSLGVILVEMALPFGTGSERITVLEGLRSGNVPEAIKNMESTTWEKPTNSDAIHYLVEEMTRSKPEERFSIHQSCDLRLSDDDRQTKSLLKPRELERSFRPLE